MRRFSSLVLCLSLVLAACADERGRTDTPAPVTSLARAIDGLRFTAPDTALAGGAVSLTVSYVNVDRLDGTGQPYHTTVGPLTGRLGADHRARLAHADVPDFSATVECPGGDCKLATLAVENRRPGRLAGIARVQRNCFRRAGVVVGWSRDEGTDRSLHAVCASLRQDFGAIRQHHDLDILGVEGGRGFFSVDVTFPNTGLRPEDANYFDSKRVSLTGVFGRGATGRLERVVSARGVHHAVSMPVTFDAYYIGMIRLFSVELSPRRGCELHSYRTRNDG